MFQFLLLVVTLGVGAPQASGQSSLPPCPRSGYFALCYGPFTFDDGRKYVGEWRDDKMNGKGTYTWPSGQKYVGEFRDDKRSGQGYNIWVSGDKYVGEWRDDTMNGQGTYTWSDGEKHIGEFRDGNANGQGTRIWVDGEKHVGLFRDGKATGEGTRFYPNGDKYVGEFLEWEKNGKGTYIWANGSKTTGIWANGDLVRELDQSPISTPSGAVGRVKLQRSGGTYEVPAVINDKMTLDFTLDSGASDVSIPADVVLVLKRMGTIRDGDLGEYRTYTLADGSKIRNRILTLRSLTVGGVKVENVEASVTDVKGSLLLGQSFLKRLGSWSIDNRTGELVVVP